METAGGNGHYFKQAQKCWDTAGLVAGSVKNNDAVILSAAQQYSGTSHVAVLCVYLLEVTTQFWMCVDVCRMF